MSLRLDSGYVKDLGYTLVDPQILKAIFYKVPQKRERLILVGVRNDLLSHFKFDWPVKAHRVYTVRDALKEGELFDCDVPYSEGQKYPKRKAEILAMVPPGGYWRDLPLTVQKEYMKGSFYLGGGKTGMARRLSWDAPSLTLTCAPAQNQTERCHPQESRPLTVREYARIQTFPDAWNFAGTVAMQYKQIGNAVPVNLAEAIGHSLVAALNNLESACPRHCIKRNNNYKTTGDSGRQKPMCQLLLAVEREKAKLTSVQKNKGLKGKSYSAKKKVQMR